MKKFLQHLSDPNPGFRCRKPGRGEDKAFRDVAIKHVLGEPASATELESLNTVLKDNAGQFNDLYSIHNGMLIYTGEEENGVRFFSVQEFEEYNELWREWFEDLEEDELWDFQAQGTAFAEIVHSDNYFVLHKRRVYYSDHDGGDDEPFGNSLSEFLERIASDPAKFLYDAGCCTRYGLEQWIPDKYMPDMQ